MINTVPENNATVSRPLISGRRKTNVTKLTPISSAGYKRPLYTRRSHARSYRKCQIRFIEDKSMQFHNALMLNESTGGMYFETDIKLLPGSIINVNMVPSPFVGIWSPDNMYKAEVRWCRPISHDHLTRFGIGVRFFPPVTQ